MALKGDGTLRAWGHNAYGELGDGTTTSRSTPVEVLGVSGMGRLAAGWYHNLVGAAGETTLGYSYDRLYRLTAVSGTSSAAYSYDPAGNRGTKGGTSYSYDRADRITAAGTTSYTVDANGNLTARGSDSFTYDQANRLRTASVGGTGSTYSYDGDGKRASKTVGGTPTSYVYDVNASLPVLLDDGTRKYVWGLGLAFAVDTSGNALVYHTDGLGSVRALTDGSGTVVQTYLYDEYGNVLSSTGSITQPFQYTGEASDAETGFMYLRARYYDVGTGRFIGRDPISGDVRSPNSLHRYAYVANNPMTFVDPRGLELSKILGNDCLTSAQQGIFGGYVVGAQCMDYNTITIVFAQVRLLPLGPTFTVPTILFAEAPGDDGGGPGGEQEPSQTAHGAQRYRQFGFSEAQYLDMKENGRKLWQAVDGAAVYLKKTGRSTWSVIIENDSGEIITAHKGMTRAELRQMSSHYGGWFNIPPKIVP